MRLVNYAGNQNLIHDQICPLCYWRHDISWTGDGYGQPGRFATMYSSLMLSALKFFELNDPGLPLEELGAHLKRLYSDAFNLHWRRFETLVADIFKRHGYRVHLTRPSKDGGADIIVYSHDSSERIGIIECKKWASDRPVTVKEVDALAGAAIRFDVHRAWLVTTSRFTKDAHRYAADYSRNGYEVDLVACGELLKLFDVYNEQLPPLHSLDWDIRQQIINDTAKQYQEWWESKHGMF
jgi:hypothetical protein